MNRAVRFPTCLFACLLFGGAAFAQDASGGRPDGPPPGPPPEAIAACVGKVAGDVVSFTGRGGETVSGTCQLDGTVLAARPTGGHRRRSTQ